MTFSAQVCARWDITIVPANSRLLLNGCNRSLNVAIPELYGSYNNEEKIIFVIYGLIFI